ncbi:sugar ABC transporter substrate-binding protein [Sphaerochaeta sp.]|uniref:ABC transporter substrate-binding protein n=1 Tax=Sphaerochaeta sp. TaxID=1972642 RepID=UPI002A358C93|nr:sugar ABC transporter substrate-binding protein [Sphaerochaeta sp.]MDX9983917.1 sugar ABC transporter substrate-binding protein [Sphaerochaeta sp.]
MKKALSIGLMLLCVFSFNVFGQGRAETGPSVVTVEFFHTTWVPKMLEILEYTIKEFEAKNPGIKIAETRTNWTDAPAQLMTSIMGGKSPDLIMTNPPMLAQFRGINALADISGYISDDFLDNLLPVAKDMIYTPDGKIDSLPQEGCNWALFYRKDLFEAAGLDPNRPPTTWDELVEMGKKLTKDTNGDGRIDQWGFGWPVQAENANDYWVNFMQQAGAAITVPIDGTWKSRLLDKEAYQATQFMVDLVRSNRISPPSIVDMDWEGVTNAFVSGEVAMMHNGAWVVGSVKDKGPELAGKWGTALLFSGPAGPAYRGHPNTFNILEASKAKDEAWKFLDFFYNEPSPYDEGLTLAGSYCNASGGMLYTHDYVEFAKKTYEPLLQPFLLAYENCKIPPIDPHWQTLSNMFVQSKVQQMIMGEASVDSVLKDLHANLKNLHGE